MQELNDLDMLKIQIYLIYRDIYPLNIYKFNKIPFFLTISFASVTKQRPLYSVTYGLLVFLSFSGIRLAEDITPTA